MSSSVNEGILHYQRKIQKYPDDEKTLLHCLKKLSRLPIGVEHLQETGIGRTVNGMRKMDGAVGEEARGLVNKWKAMVAAEDEKSDSDDEEPRRLALDADKTSKTSKTKENNGIVPNKQEKDTSSKSNNKHSAEASGSRRHEKSESSSSSKKRSHEKSGIASTSGRSFEEALDFSGAVSSKSKSKDKDNKKKVSKVNDVALPPCPAPLEIRPLDLEISPHYKPLPQRSLAVPDSPPHSKNKKVSDEEALSVVMSQKGMRTKVFSGNRAGLSYVPSLFESCTRVLQENIDSLEYTGGVPYDLLKPVLERATVQQLFALEDFNPYLLDDTDELWKFHCQREYKKAQRQEMETWRELYLRCHHEREARLKNLTANIQQQMAKATPVRTTKLAYVDSVAKPPRNAAKAQLKSGASAVVANMTKIKSSARPFEASAHHSAGVDMAAEPVRAGHLPTPRASSSSAPAAKKPKVAPLMQKTLKFIKNRYKR